MIDATLKPVKRAGRLLVKVDDGYAYKNFYVEQVGGFVTSNRWVATNEQTDGYYWADTLAEVLDFIDGNKMPSIAQTQPLY